MFTKIIREIVLAPSIAAGGFSRFKILLKMGVLRSHHRNNITILAIDSPCLVFLLGG